MLGAKALNNATGHHLPDGVIDVAAAALPWDGPTKAKDEFAATKGKVITKKKSTLDVKVTKPQVKLPFMLNQ